MESPGLKKQLIRNWIRICIGQKCYNRNHIEPLLGFLKEIYNSVITWIFLLAEHIVATIRKGKGKKGVGEETMMNATLHLDTQRSLVQGPPAASSTQLNQPG
jgi:hypothetical protein